MSIAGAVRAKPPVSLQEALHKHLKRTDIERPPWRLHGSSITRQEKAFCGREVLIKHKLGKRDTEHVATSMAVTWRWGRMVESEVRRLFAEMGMAVGDWQCTYTKCKHVVRWSKQPAECPKCGGERFTYEELRAISPYSGIGCGLDLLLNRGEPKLTLVEVKSIDKDKFADLKGPLGEHKLRMQLYLRCIAESGQPELEKINTQRGVVLYVTKGGYGTMVDNSAWTDAVKEKFSPFKEYPVERMDKDTDALVEAARATKLALEGKGPVPERICATYGVKRAQGCSVVGPCFKAGDSW